MENKTKELLLYKKLLLILITLLLLNPIAIYLLSNKIFISIFIPLLIALFVQLCYQLSNYKWVTVYLINFLAIISIFLYGELIFNSNFKEYIIKDPYTIANKYYFNKPYLRERFLDKEYATDYVTNKQGYRIAASQEPNLEIKNIDWLFIGDSFTQGAQVDFEELFTSLLYRKYPDKIIVNAGISGLGIVDEYNYYKREGHKLKPNKVFLQIGNFNDFMNVTEKQVSFTDYLMHYSNCLRFLLYGLRFQHTEDLPLGRWAEPFSPDEDLNKNFNIFYTETSEHKTKDIQEVEKYLTLFNKEVKKNGAELIVLLIPTKEQIYSKYLNEVISNFHINPEKLDMEYPNKLMKDLTKSLTVDLIDFKDWFKQAHNNLFFEQDENLSKEGHKVVASGINNYLERRNIKTSTQILSQKYTGDRYPSQSKDGKYISFQSFRDGNTEIFIANNSLQEQNRLTSNYVDESHPMLSADGKKIVFTVGNQMDFMTEVCLANIDGTNKEIITGDKELFGAIPTFDITSKQIVYAEWFKEPNKNKYSNSKIVILNLANGKKEYLTSDRYENWRPIVSPNSQSAVYISKRKQGKFDIYQYDLKAMTEINLTNTPYDEWDPMYSKDGKYIVYAGFKNKNWDLFILDTSTGKKSQITRSIGNEWDPSFTNDNMNILYAGTFGVFDGIYKMPFLKKD